MTIEDRHHELFDHLVEEFREFGSAAVDFLVTAADLAESGDPERQPRLAEAIAYCVREALKRILDSVEQPSAGRWQSVSRGVTQAKKKFDRAREFPGADEEGTLDELLRTIDQLDDFHNEEGLHERRIIAVLVSRTGSVPMQARSDTVLEYQALIKELNAAVHEEFDLASVRESLDHALRLLRLLFLPPDLRLAELDELASISQPTTHDAARLRDAVVVASHLEYFFGRAVTTQWLDHLTNSGVVTPPLGQAPWPVYRLIENLAESASEDLARWLDEAYDRWGAETARARYLVRGAADLGQAGHNLFLRALEDHQQDPTICHTVQWALRDVEPSNDIIREVSEYLLNDQSGLHRISDVHREHGVLGKLVEGITVENAPARLRLLAFKVRSLPASDWARGLTLRQRSGSIADARDALADEPFLILLDGLLVAIERALSLEIDAGSILEAIEVLDRDLLDRLRPWTLTVDSAFDPDRAIEEIRASIASRPPSGDDMRLVDRVVSEEETAGYLEVWRAALGPSPEVDSIAAALSANTVDDDWFRARDWTAILPPECGTEWRTANALLAGAYGPVTRELFESRPRGQMRTGRSPLTAEELLSISTPEAAATVARWRPDPSDSLVGARELARTLEEAVKQAPDAWLEAPLETIATLREPIYISHYFRAIAQTGVDLSRVGEDLVEAVAFCRSHPWEPTALGRDDWDYDPNWAPCDQDGIAVLQKLADSDAGFGRRLDDAWDIVTSAARDRSAASSIVSPREDPLQTAINRSCTKALEAAISLMAFEFRGTDNVRPEGLDLLDESLHLPGWNGAEHRAIIAPRLGFLLHVAPDWVNDRANLFLGREAPDELAATTVDMAVKWGQPNRWLFERAQAGILDSVRRKVENALATVLIGMLWRIPDYEPEKLVGRLAQLNGEFVSDAGRVLAHLLRGDATEAEHLAIGVEFWDAVLHRGRSDELVGFGWWAEVHALADSMWERRMKAAAERAEGKLAWSHAVAERVAKPPVSTEGLAILNELVRGQVDEWDRVSIIDKSVEALRSSKETLRETAEYKRLRTTLIERGRFDIKEL